MFFQRFTEQLKTYFTFTRRERNGVVVLMILIFIMQGVNIYIRYYEPAHISSQDKHFEKEILAFEMALTKSAASKIYCPS